MKNTFKKLAIFLFLSLSMLGCEAKESSPNSLSWEEYRNENFAFSMKVPKSVLSDYADETSWETLNVFEDEDSVYFTTDSLEDTLKDHSWDFKIGGSTLKSKEDALSFLEGYYEVDGCQIEFKEDEDSRQFKILIYAENPELMPDDPYACFIGGKVHTVYDEISGKLLTYQLLDQYFFIPGASVGEESLASLEFQP
jgi:hypothetical protein